MRQWSNLFFEKFLIHLQQTNYMFQLHQTNQLYPYKPTIRFWLSKSWGGGMSRRGWSLSGSNLSHHRK